MMEKDFDKWNEKKKLTNKKFSIFGVHEREIWWISIGVNVGVEMDGKHEDFERPVIIIRRFNRDMVWVLPTTRQVKDRRFHEPFSFSEEKYFAVLTQIRTVSTKRFLRKVGMVPLSDFDKIKDRIVNFIVTNENPPLSGSPRRPKP